MHKLIGIFGVTSGLFVSLGLGNTLEQLLPQAETNVAAETQINADVTTETNTEAKDQENVLDAFASVGAQVVNKIASPTPAASPESNNSPAVSPSPTAQVTASPTTSASPSPVASSNPSPTTSSSPDPSTNTSASVDMETNVDSTIKITLPGISISL